MEYVFEISFCLEDCKVKLATCTLADPALTWWDRYAKTIGVSNANAISWSELNKNMIKEYWPREEMKKLEQELWSLEMKEADIAASTNYFYDLSTLCPRMVTLEYKKIERYIWGFPQPIQGLVTASKPTTYDIAKRV